MRKVFGEKKGGALFGGSLFRCLYLFLVLFWGVCFWLYFAFLCILRCDKGEGGENVLCLDIIIVIKHDNGKCDRLCQMSEAISVYYKECTHTHTHTHTFISIYIAL